MKMAEFVRTYCADIMETKERQKQLFDDEPFPFEDIIHDEDGMPVKIVYAGQTEIPISEILGMSRDEFEKVYPSSECMVAYDNYVENVIIIEGEEALHRIRNILNAEKDRIDAFNAIPEGLL